MDVHETAVLNWAPSVGGCSPGDLSSRGLEVTRPLNPPESPGVVLSMVGVLGVLAGRDDCPSNSIFGFATKFNLHCGLHPDD